jgi:hypothetical protein
MYMKTSRVITLITTAMLNFSIAIDALGNSGITNLLGQKCTPKGTDTTGSCNLTFQPEKSWVCSGMKFETQYNGCNSCTSGDPLASCAAYDSVISATNDCQKRSRTGFCELPGCTPTYGEWDLWSTQSHGKTCM